MQSGSEQADRAAVDSGSSEVSDEGAAALIRDQHREDEVFPPPDVILPKRTTVIMEPLTVLFCIAFQGLGPLISQYVYYRMGRELGLAGNSSQARQCNASDRFAEANTTAYALTQLVQDRASSWILYRDVVSAATAAVSIPLLSSWSDRVGRRAAVLLPCAGSFVESAVSLSVVYFELPLACLLVAAAASGLCGGIGCLFAGALAYLADITPIGARPMRITLLEALTGLGGAGASILIGWWIRWQGYLMPHAFCTLVYLATAIFCIFCVPEVRCTRSYPQPQVSSCAAITWRMLTEPVRGLWSLMQRPHGLPAVYCLVFGGVALYCAAFYGTLDLTVLYSMNYPFCLDSVFIGYFGAAKQFVLQAGMLAVVWLFHPAMSTLSIASLGVASTALGSVLLAVAWDQTMLWVSIAVSIAAGCPVPMYRAFVSIVTPADRQGCIFSVFGVLQMLSYLVGNVGFTYGYKATLMWQTGFVFYTVAAALVLGLLLTLAAQLSYNLRTSPAMKAAAAASADDESNKAQSSSIDRVIVVNDAVVRRVAAMPQTAS